MTIRTPRFSLTADLTGWRFRGQSGEWDCYVNDEGATAGFSEDRMFLIPADAPHDDDEANELGDGWVNVGMREDDWPDSIKRRT